MFLQEAAAPFVVWRRARTKQFFYRGSGRVCLENLKISPVRSGRNEMFSNSHGSNRVSCRHLKTMAAEAA